MTTELETQRLSGRASQAPSKFSVSSFFIYILLTTIYRRFIDAASLLLHSSLHLLPLVQQGKGLNDVSVIWAPGDSSFLDVPSPLFI